MNRNYDAIVLNLLLILAITAFGIFLFKHLSYPLLWNDESHGAMGGERILQYGYPRIHDEKGNPVFEIPKDDNISPKTFYNPTWDISTYIPWGNEYVAAVGVLLSKCTDDIYQKTALVRLPFASAGFLGVLVFAYSLGRLCASYKLRRWCQIAFVSMELLSVSLILHMREARYYSVMILIQSIAFFIFLDFNIYKKYKPRLLLFLMTLLLFLTYHINFALLYFLAFTWIALQTILVFLDSFFDGKKHGKEGWKIFITAVSPVFMSMVLILPFELLIFKTYKLPMILINSGFFSQRHLTQLAWSFSVFCQYEWFVVGIIFKFLFIVMFLSRKNLPEHLRTEYQHFLKISLFLNILFFTAIFVVSRSKIFFSRYIIPFQPVMVLAIIVEGYMVLRWLLGSNRIPRVGKTCFLLAIIACILINLMAQWPFLQERVTELRDPYQGPLDFIIPYIRQTYPKPEKLVIATDYETYSYLFYLKARVLIGWIPLHLKEDLKYSPDILIYRKFWGQNPEPFNHFFQQAEYRKTCFPVVDYPVNNIPELYLPNDLFTHHFRTVQTDNQQYQAIIYEKIE